MHPMGNPRDHFWLTIGMTKALGVDLGEAMKTGQIGQDQYAEIVTKCRTCDDPDGCRRLLDAGQKLEQAPEFCRNRARLSKLVEETA